MKQSDYNLLKNAEASAHAAFNDRLIDGETEAEYEDSYVLGWLKSTISIVISNEDVRRSLQKELL